MSVSIGGGMEGERVAGQLCVDVSQVVDQFLCHVCVCMADNGGDQKQLRE